MSEENLLSIFPQKRIKPFDGMSITADVWDKAHAYHRQSQQAHNLFFHGSGVLAGMEVVASDPADHIIYILPGIAVDPRGQVIVLSEPIAYDIGNEVEGALRLYITRRESSPAASASAQGEDPLFVQDEFLISARPARTDTASVELARFVRENRTSAIRDAAEPFHPGINEIDLRYRRQLEVSSEEVVTAAVVYAGNIKEKNHGHGLAGLARLARQTSHIHLIVDDDARLDSSVANYSMIYLVGEGKPRLSAAQEKGLQGYIEHGGMLMVEYHDETSKAAFLELATGMGITFEPVTAGHALLSSPFRFGALPAGEEMLLGKGFLLCSRSYGKAWCGGGAEQPMTREEIRSAEEWGINLLNYIVERRAA